jgi:hypothetical protein
LLFLLLLVVDVYDGACDVVVEAAAVIALGKSHQLVQEHPVAVRDLLKRCVDKGGTRRREE